MPRTPVNLHMHRELGCGVCVLAQILYIYGAIDRINLQGIERMTHCQPNDALSRMDMYGFLLERGFIVHEYSTYSPELFLQHGIAYLRSTIYQGAWDESTHGAYFTPERLHDLQHRTVRFMAIARKARAEGRYFPNYRQVEIFDISAALQRNCVVDVTMKGSDAVTQHAALFAPPTEGLPITGWLYDPKLEGDTVRHTHLRQDWGRVLPAEGAAVIWPR